MNLVETQTRAIEQSLEELDLTRIIDYSNKIENLTKGANTMTAPIALRDFIMAFDETNTILSKVVKMEIEAQDALKKAEAIAFLETSMEYCSIKNIKPTDNIRKNYTAMDPNVTDAKKTLAKCTAMTSFLKNKLQVFRLCHDDMKKIAYYADNNNSGYEGM